MVRTQIQITERQYEALKAKAARQGLSLAAIIRQSLDMMLWETPEVDRKNRLEQALSVAGQFRSGLSDLSSNHDRYLAEAYKE